MQNSPKCLDKRAKESEDYVKALRKMFGDACPYVTMQSCKPVSD